MTPPLIAPKAALEFEVRTRLTCSDYMNDLINYGGTMVPRGYAYQMLLDIAKARGFKKRECYALADRWMQGYDLSQQIKARAQCGATGKPRTA